MLKNKSRAAELGLLITAMIWGTAFVVVKNTTDAVPVNYLLAIRFLLATAVLSAVFFKVFRKLDLLALRNGLILGALLYLSYDLQTIGIQYTTAGNNAFLTAIYVVLVPFLYWIIRRQRPKNDQILAAFICMAGIGVLSLQSNFSLNVGDLLSLLCGVAFCGQIVAVSIFTEKQDPILLTILQFFFSGLFSLIGGLGFETFPAALDGNTILGLLFLGIFSTAIALCLQVVCQKYTTPSRASLIMSLESLFGCLSGILFLGEPVTFRIVCGFALIFLAILISELGLDFLKKKTV